MTALGQQPGHVQCGQLHMAQIIDLSPAATLHHHAGKHLTPAMGRWMR